MFENRLEKKKYSYVIFEDWYLHLVESTQSFSIGSVSRKPCWPCLDLNCRTLWSGATTPCANGALQSLFLPAFLSVLISLPVSLFLYQFVCLSASSAPAENSLRPIMSTSCKSYLLHKNSHKLIQLYFFHKIFKR